MIFPDDFTGKKKSSATLIKFFYSFTFQKWRFRTIPITFSTAETRNFTMHLLRIFRRVTQQSSNQLSFLRKISQLRGMMRTYPNYGVQLRHRDLFRPINSGRHLLLMLLRQKGQDLSDDRVQSLRYFGLHNRKLVLNERWTFKFPTFLFFNLAQWIENVTKCTKEEKCLTMMNQVYSTTFKPSNGGQFILFNGGKFWEFFRFAPERISSFFKLFFPGWTKGRRGDFLGNLEWRRKRRVLEGASIEVARGKFDKYLVNSQVKSRPRFIWIVLFSRLGH